MGYLDYAGLQYLWGKLKEKLAPKSHSHDDRYYTESEMDGKLSGKADNTRAGANDLINKLDSGTAAPVDDDLIITQWANHTTAAAANKNQYVRRPMSSIWNYIKGKTDGVYQPKGSYAASGHTHDDRYYTESEMNTKLSGKSNTDHTHKNVNDIGSNKPTTFAYSKSGMNYGDYSWLAGWNGYELRAVNKNQFAITGHTHTKDQVGLGNVDNTADANKSVKYATSAGNASKVNNHTVNIDVPANAKFTDTTYGVATASSNGLMSSTDKTKLDDFSRVISIQKQIKLTTDWQDTGIAGNNLETGTYIIQVSGFNSSYTQIYSEMYSGIMTWYASETNDLNNDEIFLHNAGHASNSNDIYLRTSRRLYSNGGLHLQIACKVAASGTDTLTFKFRRLI